MSWIDLGAAGPADDGQLREVSAGARRVGLARCCGRWIAFDPWCTHAQCPLTDGTLEGTSVRCACHGALFDLETGVPLAGPALDPIRLFPTRVVDGRLEVDLT